MHSAWSGTAAALKALDLETVEPRLRTLVALLQHAMAGEPGHAGWVVALDVRLLRLARRIDAAIVTPRAVLAIQFRPKARAFSAADRTEAEDAALDLADFHAGSAELPILPVVLIPNGARARPQWPLPLAGAAAPLDVTRLSLPVLLTALRSFPDLGRDPAAWLASAYQPVPGLMEAACLLYRRHGVTALHTAAAPADAIARTRRAAARAIARTMECGERRVILLTGRPGAGKTLIGLDLAFAEGAAFLTGNPTLVHVLRAALVRDAGEGGLARRAAARRVEAVIQSLPQVRDDLVVTGAPLAERLVVVDEAQRCWSRDYATGKTRNRAVKLTDSEPGILLDALARRSGPAVVLALIGAGQEIHNGETGVAGWYDALGARPEWRLLAPRLEKALDGAECDPDLHLDTPIRAVRSPATASWVDAVLGNDPAGAAAIAADGIPFAVTRSLAAMREALRPRGARSAGLLASAHAARLRAEGLGGTLAHQDPAAVAHWFLERWPDVRSSDALEVAATEFAAQGLELDRAGLCWDLDLVRDGDRWAARRFRASAWTRAGLDATGRTLNAYRVLLTRARHGTIIWVPGGDSRDRTRESAAYDAIAAYLQRCGAAALDGTRASREDHATVPGQALL